MSRFRKNRVRLSVERLDIRVLPSVTYDAPSHRVEIVGNNGSETYNCFVASVGGTPTLRVEEGTGAGKITHSFDLLTQPVSLITGKLANGNDLFTCEPNLTIPVRVDGELGNDTVVGGAMTDTLLGGDGNDNLTGNGGADSLVGGNQNDNLFGNDGADTLQGNAGNDLLEGNKDTDRLEGNDNNDTINGGSENDTILGHAGNDSIHGNDGDDNILGDIGHDRIWGDQGFDTIDGGVDSNDTIYGGTENDTISGNSGNDRIYGESGEDELEGNDGADFIDGGTGFDTLEGGNQNDTLYGGEANDSLDGGEGNDTIRGEGPNGVFEFGNDTIRGGTGNDTIYGDIGNDLLYGDANNDTVYGGAGEDRMYGNAGNDALNGDAGNDQLFGDVGTDTLNGGNNDDTLVSIDVDTADVLIGGNGFDSFWGDQSGKNKDKVNGATAKELDTNTHFVSAFSNVADKTMDGDILADPNGATTWDSFADHPLFPLAGPQVTDIDQGALGDCWLLSSLATAVNISPNVARQLICDMGDETYAVQISDTFWRVDADLPVVAAGFDVLEFAQVGNDGCTWVPLVEKAWAMHRGNDYSHLENDTAYFPLGRIGGTNRQLHNINEVVGPFAVNGFQTLMSIHNNGWAGVFNTRLWDFLVHDTVSSHAYAIISVTVDANNQPSSILLYNPHGVDNTPLWDANGDPIRDANGDQVYSTVDGNDDGFVTLTPNQFANDAQEPVGVITADFARYRP